MEKKNDILENFKTAIASTIKSISGDQEIEVVFGNKSSKDKKKYCKFTRGYKLK